MRVPEMTEAIPEREEEEQQQRARGYREAFAQAQRIKEVNDQFDYKHGDSGDMARQNQVNVTIHKGFYSEEKRIELAILAMRQRNRFKQVKRLGLAVPSKYPRIHAVTTLPKFA